MRSKTKLEDGGTHLSFAEQWTDQRADLPGCRAGTEAQLTSFSRKENAISTCLRRRRGGWRQMVIRASSGGVKALQSLFGASTDELPHPMNPAPRARRSISLFDPSPRSSIPTICCEVGDMPGSTLDRNLHADGSLKAAGHKLLGAPAQADSEEPWGSPGDAAAAGLRRGGVLV